MTTSGSPDLAATGRRRRMWFGVALLAAGLLGHLFAARAIGGTFIAYRDHIGGFLILSLVSGAIIAGLGYRFWRGRRDVTVLVLGALQALVGLLIYLERFHIG